MDALWSQTFSSASLDQMAQALGVGSPDQLPPIGQVSDAQISLIAQRVGADAAEKLQILRVVAGTPDNPTLEQPTVDFGDGSSLTLLLTTLQAKVNELQINTSQEAIKANKEKLKAQHEENQKKIQETLDKLDKSAKSGVLSKVFGWIGAVVALVAAVAAAIVTGGAAAPVVAAVIAALAIGMMALQESGVMDKMMDAMFGDNNKAKMAFMICLQVAMMVASIATAVCSGGASAAATVSKLAKIAQIAADAAGGACQVAGGAAGIATGAYSYQVSMAQADQKEIQAWIAKFQGQMDDEMENLKKLLKQLQDGFTGAMDMLNDIADSKSNIMQFTNA